MLFVSLFPRHFGILAQVIDDIINDVNIDLSWHSLNAFWWG
jgi:hypothetical protein